MAQRDIPVSQVSHASGCRRSPIVPQPNTQLIKIRPSALLNTLTLREFYPQHFTATFSATQWVSLHLALQHSRHARRSSAPPSPRDRWAPFLRTLPRDFPTVPLTWSIARRSNSELIKYFGIDEDDRSLAERRVEPRLQRWQTQLLERMPPSVRTRSDEVEERFKKDWAKVKLEWAKHRSATPDEQDELHFLDYFLAWLNVNTRCVYYDVGSKTSDALTLAPVIDMASLRCCALFLSFADQFQYNRSIIKTVEQQNPSKDPSTASPFPAPRLGRSTLHCAEATSCPSPTEPTRTACSSPSMGSPWRGIPTLRWT